MIPKADYGPVVQLENGTYQVSLPGYGEVIFVLRRQPVAICCSCHRELDGADELATTDPNVCRRCYAV